MQVYNELGPKMVKVFFVISDGSVTSVKVGNNLISHNAGFQFYVDDYVAEQIHKCELMLDGFRPKLVLKEGETLDVPTEEDEKEKEIKELEERLQQLKAE